jgi:hypothetical protein
LPLCDLCVDGCPVHLLDDRTRLRYGITELVDQSLTALSSQALVLELGHAVIVSPLRTITDSAANGATERPAAVASRHAR